LEYQNNANYNETLVSSDFRIVIWNLTELGIGTTITITYKAEAVSESNGSNIVSVRNSEATSQLI